MTLPSSGTISMAQVNVEIGHGSNAVISLGESAVRTLAGVPSGPVSLSQLYGKSSYTPMSGTGVDGLTEGVAAGVQYTDSCYPYVTVSGGSGGYTFAWTFITANGSTLVNPTSSNPTVRHSIGKFGYTGTSTLQCVITDSTSHQITVSPVNATFSIEDGSGI
ncbi:hypothetical protein [Janthinobacterium lividum]|uniref:hypothetical protein n=1 Tax=Janthinobacterium lividum TaxID=29581 RepID=UPI001CD870AE|nr:hypothetical protein [Janthinobacterium lividum]